jgi:REP element-mobilizing transposase RayT
MTFYRRDLPHWQPPDRDIFLTWRLYGSLPARIRLSEKKDPKQSDGQRFMDYDRALDSAKVGPLWLKDPKIAESVIATFKEGQAEKLFQVRVYTLMANHVHALIAPVAPLPKITQLIKGRSAKAANRILARQEVHFWQKESFDHWVRNPGEWEKIKKYIEQNPVKAGLVAKAEDWPWSSITRPIL